MRLYLVRHAQSRANADAACRDVDCDLTELGYRQAQLVAEALALQPVTAVLTSPYRRTVLTARAIAARCGVGMGVLPSAHEHHPVTPVGWIPPARAEIIWRYPDVAVPVDMAETTWHQLPETVEQVADRMRGVLDTLRSSQTAGDALVLVSHASPLQQLIGVATAAYTPQAATQLVIGNASLTVLDLSVAPARLEMLAQTTHLDVASVPVLL